VAVNGAGGRRGGGCHDAAGRAMVRPAMDDLALMRLALAEAEAGAAAGEVPIGALLVDADGTVVARAHNRVEALKDPTAHAELLVIREGAAKLDAKRLPGCSLVVTLEPCAMCAAAASFARLARVVYGADDSKGGGVRHGARVFEQPTCHWRPAVTGGIEPERAGALLREFFRARR
jgi:tRNA(Arg) A34 adenosine deaminase TadA